MGYISSWYHRIAGSGILDHGADFPYDCENVRVEISNHDLRVPTGSMRSTAHSPNAFAREVFMDEAARLAVHDPVDYRLAQLSGNARLEQVLQRVAKMSDWYAPGKHGLAKGVAVHPSKGSFVAQVAEISVSESGEILVHRIWCALDCGLVINPDSVKAQIEGAILFGLTSALYASISISDGRIQENNFDSYPLLSISGTPSVEIEIVSSTASPSGIGEIGVPPVAPAVSNAVFALTKRRLRDLPLRLGHS